MRSRVPAAWLLGAVLATLHTCAPMMPAFGQRRSPAEPIAVGPTGAKTGGVRAGRALRTALEQELGSIEGVRVAPTERARWIVHGSVTRLERRDAPDGLEVHCEVSLFVADARSGSIRAMLSGRAGARGRVAPPRLEQTAMEAAVRGALGPIPGSLRTR